jgi:hypothetical protein
VVVPVQSPGKVKKPLRSHTKAQAPTPVPAQTNKPRVSLGDRLLMTALNNMNKKVTSYGKGVTYAGLGVDRMISTVASLELELYHVYGVSIPDTRTAEEKSLVLGKKCAFMDMEMDDEDEDEDEDADILPLEDRLKNKTLLLAKLKSDIRHNNEVSQSWRQRQHELRSVLLKEKERRVVMEKLAARMLNLPTQQKTAA